MPMYILPWLPFNEYYLLVIAALLFSIWAQFQVSSNYKKYSAVISRRGLTGAQAARMILDQNGLQEVAIERVSGRLTDHYDPRTNVIRLSDAVYDNASVAAIGVAAHESGHAIQYATGYKPIKLRALILPITSIGSNGGLILFLIGLVMNFSPLIVVGLVLFSFIFLFQLVTLPVEFNASRRALSILQSSGMLDEQELAGSRRVLRAAAMTYVAAMASALAQLVYYIAMASNRRRR